MLKDAESLFRRVSTCFDVFRRVSTCFGFRIFAGADMDQVLHVMGMKPKVQTGSPAVALDDEASSFGKNMEKSENLDELVEDFMAIGRCYELKHLESGRGLNDSVLHEGSQDHKDILKCDR